MIKNGGRNKSKGWVYFGYSIKSSLKVKIIPLLNQIKDDCPKKQEKLREQFMEKKYNECKSIWTHGVAIRLEIDNGVKKCYIYDNACKKRSEYSVVNLAKRISFPFIVRAFDVYL